MPTSSLTPPPDRPGLKPFQAYGAVASMWGDRTTEIVMEGPAGCGKTRGGLEKLDYCARKYPMMRGLIVRKTRESLTESALVTWEQKVHGSDSPMVDGASRSSRHRYVYPNGSEIIIGGLLSNSRDQRAKIMSTEYDMIVAPEATEFTEEDWEKLISRLRNGVMPYQQIIGDCNPDAPTHWLHQRCDKGVARCYFVRHTDNPAVTEAYIANLNRLTGVRRARYLEGKRAAAEGTVYEFDRAIHLIEPRFIPPPWTRIRGIDFGYTNPFVCLWFAVDPDGRMYLYREIYMTKRTVADHAPQIIALSKGESYAATVADHDAEDRATLQKHSIATVPADKRISAGIQAVEDRLAIAGDGKPRLFVVNGSLVERDEELAESKHPVCTQQEFDAYVWPKGVDGKPVKEKPVDMYNHGMDVLRYCVMWADRHKVGRPKLFSGDSSRSNGGTRRVGSQF